MYPRYGLNEVTSVGECFRLSDVMDSLSLGKKILALQRLGMGTVARFSRMIPCFMSMELGAVASGLLRLPLPVWSVCPVTKLGQGCGGPVFSDYHACGQGLVEGGSPCLSAPLIWNWPLERRARGRRSAGAQPLPEARRSPQLEAGGEGAHLVPSGGASVRLSWRTAGGGRVAQVPQTLLFLPELVGFLE